MTSKTLVLFAIGLTLVCCVAGKFIGHHHHHEDNEAARNEEGHSEEEHSHHHHHHRHHHHHHGHHHHHHHHKCLDQDLTITKKDKEVRKTCWTELKERSPTEAPHGEKNEHHHKRHMPKLDACYAACRFEKLDLVEDGELNMEAVKKHIEATFPEAAHKNLTEGITECNSKLNTTLSHDNGCNSYVPLTQCVMGTIFKSCKSKDSDNSEHHRHHHHHHNHHHHHHDEHRDE